MRDSREREADFRKDPLYPISPKLSANEVKAFGSDNSDSGNVRKKIIEEVVDALRELTPSSNWKLGVEQVTNEFNRSAPKRIFFSYSCRRSRIDGIG